MPAIEKRVYDIENNIKRIKAIEGHGDLGDMLVSFQLLPALRGFWPLNNSDGSGVIPDISGNAKSLTASGGITLTDWSIPYLDFNGTTGYLYRADEATFDITGAITFGGWFYQDTLTSRGLIGKFAAAGQRSYYLVNTGSADYSVIISTDGTALVTTPSSVTPVANVWRFIVGRYIPSTEVSIFVNGIETSNTTSIPASLFNSNSQLRIGSRGDGAEFLDGRACLCFVCGAALDDLRITRMFNSSRWLFGV